MAERAEPPSTLWHGRIDAEPADALLAYTASLSFDRRLWRDDVAGSRAHVRGLVRVGLVSDADGVAISTALDKVEAELATDRFVFADGDEDIHTAIERRVTEIAGDAGARLHTARSRNDQVATDLRLWCKRELVGVARKVDALQRVLLERALAAGDAYLPGYTHLQRAQAVLLSHHLLAHGWALGRDVERLLDARRRVDVSPLGACALAGTSLPIDPAATAAELGFARAFDNSLDAVSDRDFVAETLFALALIGVHLGRIGEEWVLWCSDEFGPFVTLDDCYATGSSMLPQKKNADIAELARAKTGRLIGNLTGLLAMLKGLPLAYNRDLQEDKEPLFDSVTQILLALDAVTGMVATASFRTDAMAAAADDPAMAATDLAEWLVRRGTPFRTAHALVGSLVARYVAGEAPLVELVTAHPDLGGEAAALIGPGRGVAARSSPGAAGPDAFSAQRDAYEAMLAHQQERL